MSVLFAVKQQLFYFARGCLAMKQFQVGMDVDFSLANCSLHMFSYYLTSKALKDSGWIFRSGKAEWREA